MIIPGERLADRAAQTGPASYLFEPHGGSRVGNRPLSIRPMADFLSGSRDLPGEIGLGLLCPVVEKGDRKRPMGAFAAIRKLPRGDCPFFEHSVNHRGRNP